ncbi:MAG TPA: ketol-acid reductoisomerase [archaeon]|nr:ketol-acid reductoisomerase [archaeon]
MKLYKEKDVKLQILKNTKIAVLGYGNQGEAQALCFRDSGLDVIIGLKKGSKSWKKVEKAGFKVFETSEACAKADLIHILIPDEIQPEVFEKEIRKNLRAGKTISFSTGFGIHFGYIKPPKNVDVILFVPFSPGSEVRNFFLEKKGVPAMIGVHQNYSGKAKQKALALAKACGCLRAGVLEGSFKEEAVQNLFGEQVALCGGQTELIKKTFETITEKGYSPEIAYLEVVRQMNLLSRLIREGGIEFMWKKVSNTAEYGGRTRGSRVIDAHVKGNMKKILHEIESGKFAREWMNEKKSKFKKFEKLRKKQRKHKIEQTREKLQKSIEK